MNSQRLRELIKEQFGSFQAFVDATGLPYGTLYYSTRTDERVGNMFLNNFKTIAHTLGMTIDELVEELEND